MEQMQWKTAVYEVQKCIHFSPKVASNGKYLKRDHVTHLKILEMD